MSANDRYAVYNRSPCINRLSRNCYFNSRTFKYTSTEEVEVITRGRKYYTYNFGADAWSIPRFISEIPKFNADVNSPCYQRDFCVFDSHTYYKNASGNLIEEVTLGTTLYAYNDSTNTWSKSELR